MKENYVKMMYDGRTLDRGNTCVNHRVYQCDNTRATGLALKLEESVSIESQVSSQKIKVLIECTHVNE